MSRLGALARDAGFADVGSGVGIRRVDFPLERLERALAEHDEALVADDQRVAKRARKSVVTRHGDLVVKEHVPNDWWGRVRDRLAPRRHLAGWLNACRLEALGIATARPLAWVRREGRAYALFEDLSGLERLDLLVFRLCACADATALTRLRDAAASWLGDLHRRGVYHGDLKGSNVLVAHGGGAVSLPLIDTDQVAFGDEKVGARRRAKNLAQLGASIPVVVTRTERLRFYRRYAAAYGQGPSEKAMARAVAAQLAQKVLVVDEPLE